MKESERKKPLAALSEDEVESVVGGAEPEEFDWREKNPVRHIGDPSDILWRFYGEGTVEGQYFKRTAEGAGHTPGELDKGQIQ